MTRRERITPRPAPRESSASELDTLLGSLVEGAVLPPAFAARYGDFGAYAIARCLSDRKLSLEEQPDGQWRVVPARTW